MLFINRKKGKPPRNTFYWTSKKVKPIKIFHWLKNLLNAILQYNSAKKGVVKERKFGKK